VLANVRRYDAQSPRVRMFARFLQLDNQQPLGTARTAAACAPAQRRLPLKARVPPTGLEALSGYLVALVKIQRGQVFPSSFPSHVVTQYS